MSPLAQVGGKAQQHIDQQGGPVLPADGVGAIAQKPAQRQRLLYPFEEHLDLPTGLVEIAHAACSPLFVVGIEWSEIVNRRLPGGDARPGESNDDHDAFLAVYFHPSLHPPQGSALVLFGPALRPFEPDDFILADAAAGRHRQAAHHGVLKVVLGPRDPGNAPDVERLQGVKIHLRLVEEHHLPALQPAGDLVGAFVVMLPGGVHDGAGGQKTAGVLPQVQLGSGVDSVAAPRLPRPAGDSFLAVCLCRPGGFDCAGGATPSP